MKRAPLLILITPAENLYRRYEGRQPIGAWTSDIPMTAAEVENLRVRPEFFEAPEPEAA